MQIKLRSILSKGQIRRIYVNLRHIYDGIGSGRGQGFAVFGKYENMYRNDFFDIFRIMEEEYRE